jgi:hypothetical protein
VDERGTAVPGVYVRMASEDGRDFGESVTDSNGQFNCFAMSGGEYRVQVYPSPMSRRAFASANGEPFSIMQVPPDGSTTGVRLAIKDERLAIRGVVTDDTGSPVSDAHVKIIGRSRGFVDLPSGMTDATGEFEIKNLAIGDYGLSAHGSDGSEGNVFGIGAGTDGVSITLVRPGSVEGTVIGFSGTPEVELATLTTRFRTTTNALVDGDRFWQRGLRPGRYAVQARAGGQVDSAEIEVRSNETVRVTLQNRRVGTIEGYAIEAETKAPVAGMRCEAKLSLAGPPPEATMQAVSDATGRFEMRAPVGNVYVLCSPPDPSLSIAGDAVEVTADAIVNVKATTVRGTSGAVRGNAGFSLTPLTLPLRINRVDPGGAAAAAGVRDGDQLVAIDGSSVQGMLPLGAMWLIWNQRPGTTVTLSIERAGVPMTFKLPVVAMPP